MPKELLVIINMYVLCVWTIFSIRDFSAQCMPGYQLHSCPYRLTHKHIKHISQENNDLWRHVKRGTEDRRLSAQAIEQLRRQDSEALGEEQHRERLEGVRENRLRSWFLWVVGQDHSGLSQWDLESWTDAAAARDACQSRARRSIFSFPWVTC